MFEKIKNRKSYKGRVFQYIFLLIAALVLLFCAYTYYDYTKECQANALREAQSKVNRIVSQNDEKLGNLRQYYVAMMDSDTIKWLLENNVDYSDYSSYKAAYDDMGSKGIFSDYVNSFTFVNFKTGWVLSSKGLFQLYEAYNSDTAVLIYEEKTKDDAEKVYWKYDTGVTLPSTVDRRYRLTIETSGLNLIMHLPASSYNTYAIFVANVDTEAWQKWVKEWLEPYEELVVLDADGALIYATDESIAEECVLQDGIIKADGTSYAAAGTASSVLGWNYYVLYDIREGQSSIRMPVAIWIAIFVLVLGCCALVGHMIYNPIDALVRDVAQTDERIAGNELEYLAGSYRDLKNDKLALEGVLYQQQDKLFELFELRLIHGEVDIEEWDEYIGSFGLRPWKRFATAVVILSPQDEEEQSIVNEDAICLKLLSEMPKSIKDKAWMPPIYNAGAIFAIFADDDDDALLEKIRKFYRQMREFAKEVCDYSILTGVSSVHTDYRHVRAAYRESINALMFKAPGGAQTAGWEDAEESCHFYLESLGERGGVYDKHFEQDIQAAVKAVDKQQCYRATDEFCHYLATLQGRDGEVSLYLMRFVNTILLAAQEIGVDLGAVYPDGVRRIYSELLEVSEPDRERRYIKWKFIDPVIAARMEYLESSQGSVVEEIKRRIADSGGSLTLAECAQDMGVHPTYIWKTLKGEGSRSYSDYVEEYKLGEAKRLLLESDLTVAEIADRLGYTNAQNFIRFFSKSMGVTPGKFRKLC